MSPRIRIDGVEVDSGFTEAEADARFLKLNQASPQKVINNAPQFDAGITITKDQPIYLDGI